jgi:predicted Zn-dependent protease
LKICNPSRAQARAAIWRATGLGAGLLAILCTSIEPAAAQAIDLVRDTEIERVLHSYEDPILNVAGLDSHLIRIYLVNDPSINAFAMHGPAQSETTDIFVNTGLIMQLKSPNEVTGVLAHETGHIAGGDLTRDSGAVAKASVPMLIGMAAGVAAMIAGAGDAGMAIMGVGAQAAQSQFLAFSRTQEATADQRGQKFLLETHQSGRGMLNVFERMADDAAMSARYSQPLISDHPADRERIDLMQREVDASPYRDVPDSPEAVHEFHMIQAKLAGFLIPVDEVLNHYPASDTSEEARYARAVAYFRQPDMQKALEEINTLVRQEPKNPYFWELLGQIYVEMSQPEKGVAPYQKSVDLLPDAPLLRVSLAAAQLATERSPLAAPALDNLKVALQQENDNTFAWFEAAQAYSQLGNQPMADLSTAERYYTVGAMKTAAHFAMLAQRKLPKGSPDWQRAGDIMLVAGPDTNRHD